MTAQPADAATVMLLRPSGKEGTSGIEVLMVLRNRKSSFVPGYYVFPGGVIDAGDYEPGVERFIQGIDRQAAANVLGDMSRPEKALGAWIGGIRETFEEVGLLLARTEDGKPVTIQTDQECRRFAGYRRAVIECKMKFTDLLEKEKLYLPGDELHYFSHWITPEFLPQRYDVRFFVTPAPQGQAPVCDGIELTHLTWLKPAEALAQYEKGKIGMVLPQIITLQELSRFASVAEALQCARKRHAPTTLTKIVQIDGEPVEVMPDGTVYSNRPPVYP